MISVVIPLRNEESNVPILVSKLTEALGTLGREYEVLFINDGSTDATAARLHEACAADRHLKAIHFRRNRSEEHTSELQSLRHLVCRLLLEKKKKTKTQLTALPHRTLDTGRAIDYRYR